MLPTSLTRSITALPLPRQHGAWAVLILSLLLGSIVGGSFKLATLLLVVSAVGGFIACHNASVCLRGRTTGQAQLRALFWAAGSLLVLILAGGVLVVAYDLWLLPAVGLFAALVAITTLVLARRKQAMSTAGELIGIAGLTLTAPAAQYVSAGAFSGQTIGLWILAAFFFCGSVFHVRYLVRHPIEITGGRAMRLRAGLPSIAYHLAALGVVSALAVLTDILPPLAFLAFLPVTLKVLWTVARRYRAPEPVYRIGYLEIIHAVVFVLLAGIAFHLPMPLDGALL